MVPPSASIERQRLLPDAARVLLPPSASILELTADTDGAATKASETPAMRVITAASAMHAVDLHVDMVLLRAEKNTRAREIKRACE